VDSVFISVENSFTESSLNEREGEDCPKDSFESGPACSRQGLESPSLLKRGVGSTTS